MREIHCRYCDYYQFSVAAPEGKVRFTCRRCKRSQTQDISRKVISPSHLQVAGI